MTFMAESRALFRLSGDSHWMAWITYFIATVYRRQGRFDLAHAACDEARRIAGTIGLSDFIPVLDHEMQAAEMNEDAGYSL